MLCEIIPDFGISMTAWTTTFMTYIGYVLSFVIGGLLAFIAIRIAIKWIRSIDEPAYLTDEDACKMDEYFYQFFEDSNGNLRERTPDTDFKQTARNAHRVFSSGNMNNSMQRHYYAEQHARKKYRGKYRRKF